jgi:hypothetical protein
MTTELRIISAMYPAKYPDDCAIYMKVWFDGLADAVDYVADPFDPEPHGRELWFRAMMGEYGEIAIFPCRRPQGPLLPFQRPPIPRSMKTEAMARCLMEIHNHRRLAIAFEAKALGLLPSPPKVKNDG